MFLQPSFTKIQGVLKELLLAGRETQRNASRVRDRTLEIALLLKEALKSSSSYFA